jgi:hypothetical protein
MPIATPWCPHERDQGLETFHLGVVPDAEVILVDEPDLLDRRGLYEDEPEAARCELTLIDLLYSMLLI